jgi:RNA polymerase sigma factor (sigma-70 family)
MLSRQQRAVLPHLWRLIGSPFGGDLSDPELLERFLGQRDAAAFAALVRRHGPAVLGVCRRVLRNGHDAEDAFQATFLVLARKARFIARREALGSWLYGVAYRVALRARADAARRRKHESQAAQRVEAQTACDALADDVRPVLDEEVSRLPDKYRRPVVLCYFEGKTYQEAARLLGWPPGTVSVRLARARGLLRRRLALRGLALSSAALAVCLAEGSASAAEVGLLADAVAGAAVGWLAGPAAAGVSAEVIALTEGVVNTMLVRKLKTLVGAFLVIGVTLGGAGALWRLTPAGAVDQPGEALHAGAGQARGESVAAADRPEPPGKTSPAPSPAAPPFLGADGPPGAPPRALATPAGEGARAPQTRIGLINLKRVFKGAKKLQAVQADLRTRMGQFQRDLEMLKKQVQQIQAECDDPTTPAGRREELGLQIKRINRESEDKRESARELMGKLQGDAVVTAYREVEEAAKRIANVRGLELVLFYNEALTEADFYNPRNLEAKLSQPGALIPMVVAPGMDITEAVIEALNRASAPGSGVRP